MTTIVRIGDYLYADDQLSYLLDSKIIDINLKINKLKLYKGHPIIYENVNVSVIAPSGTLNEYETFIKLLENMLITVRSAINSVNEDKIMEPVNINNIIYTILTCLNKENKISFPSLTVVLGGTNIETNKPDYRLVNFHEKESSEFKPGDVTGSGADHVNEITDLLDSDSITENMLPFFSKFDESTGENFYKFYPLTKIINKVNKPSNKVLESMSNKMIKKFSKRIMFR